MIVFYSLPPSGLILPYFLNGEFVMEDKERTLKVLTWKLLMEGFDREAAMDLAKVAGEMPREERVYAALEGVGERWPTWFGDRVGDYAAGWGRELLEEGKMVHHAAWKRIPAPPHTIGH